MAELTPYVDRPGLQASNLKPYEIPVGEVYCDNDFNCRGPIVPVDVDDLTRSIDANGLQQPIVIQPWKGRPGKNWRIISGHRRYTAFVVLKKTTIPAIIVEGLTELGAKKLNLEENLKRKDLNILQEAKALQIYFDAKWTIKDIAQDIQQPDAWVRTRMLLLRLPNDIQMEAAAGYLTQQHIQQLGVMKKPEQQYAAVKRIKESKLAGERKRIEIKPKKPIDGLKRRKRERHEMFTLQTTLRETLGNGLYTRVLAWAAGEINDFEIHRDIRDEAAKKGIKYEIPTDVQAALTS